jgi:hypothetical protein
MKNIVLTAKNFSLLLCLCGCLAAQAEPVKFGENLQWEIVNDMLRITSPKTDSIAKMTPFDSGYAPWADDSLSIKAVEMPDNLTTIAVSAFESCKSLQEVTIPANVTNIYSWAFRNCANLKKVTCLPATPPELATDVFAYCHNELVLCVPSVGTYKSNGWELYEDKLSMCSVPTAVDNTHVDAAATKIIESNQLIIIRNNEKYTITGKKL